MSLFLLIPFLVPLLFIFVFLLMFFTLSKKFKSIPNNQDSMEIFELEQDGLLFIRDYFDFSNDLFINDSYVNRLNQLLLEINHSYLFLMQHEADELESSTKETKRILEEFKRLNASNKEELQETLHEKLAIDILNSSELVNTIRKRAFQKAIASVEKFNDDSTSFPKTITHIFLTENDINPYSEKRRIALINIKNKELKLKKNKYSFYEIQYKLSLIKDFLDGYYHCKKEDRLELDSHLSQMLSHVNSLIDRYLDDKHMSDVLRRKLEREIREK